MPDEDSEFAKGSVDLLKIMMLTGSLVGIFSVFQLWFYVDFSIFQFEYTGYDFFTRHYVYPDTGYFIYVPLFVLIISLMSLIPATLSFTKHERIGAVGGIATGVAMLISTLSYVLYPESKIRVSQEAYELIADIKLADYIDAGVYSAIIASMFLMIGGMIILLYRRSDKKNNIGG